MEPPPVPTEATAALAELRAKLDAAEAAMTHNEVSIRRLEQLAGATVAPAPLVADAGTNTGSDAGGCQLSQHLVLSHLHALVERERRGGATSRDRHLAEVTELTREGMMLLAAASEPLAVMAAPGVTALRLEDGAAGIEAEDQQLLVQPLPASALLDD